MTTLAAARPAPAVALPLRRADRFVQAQVLREALALLGGHGDVAVFDLDSTLLDNRPRQARIVREFGRFRGDVRLDACRPEMFVDWRFAAPLAACGLEADEVTALEPLLKAFWSERFFTSEYAQDDVAIAGASSFLSAVKTAGAQIAYVTGRAGPMGPGTFHAFVRAGFPLPDGVQVHALLKPDPAMDDDQWKRDARTHLDALGTVRVAFDNEPTHVNQYRAGYEGCLAVHLDTDHSGRPVEVHADVPSIRDFVL